MSVKITKIVTHRTKNGVNVELVPAPAVMPVNPDDISDKAIKTINALAFGKIEAEALKTKRNV